MNVRGVRGLIRRDLDVMAQTPSVMLPLVTLPLLLLVAAPAMVGLIGGVAGSLRLSAVDEVMAGLLARLPPEIVADLPGTGDSAQAAAATLLYLYGPVYLIVPLTVALVLAADSIAGERERGTLEGLLLTPLSDREIFTAKLLAAWVPAATIGILGVIAYWAVVDVTLGVAAGQWLLPNLSWLLLALWVGPALSAFALSVGVLISAQARSAQGAQQIGSIFVLGIVVVLAGQATALLILAPVALVLLGAFLWAVTGLLVVAGATWVSRSRLALRLG